MSTYSYERVLVEEFISAVSDCTALGGPTSVGREFDFQRGRTDVILKCSDGTIIAVEAKLKRWRDAANQAYRNLAFAHHSYVLLPPDQAERVREETATTLRIGVCTLKGGSIEIVLDAPRCEPLQSWLTARAQAHATICAQS